VYLVINKTYWPLLNVKKTAVVLRRVDGERGRFNRER
jgi:hypothetical protein